jgi:hypothetical protein
MTWFDARSPTAGMSRTRRACLSACSTSKNGGKYALFPRAISPRTAGATLLSADLEEHGYRFLDTAKRVRDRCREAGHPVSRADVDFVLRGLVFRGYRFEEHPNTPADLTDKFTDNVRSLCLREQIVLDVPTERMIRNWIGSA